MPEKRGINSAELLSQLFPMTGSMLKDHRDVLFNALEPYTKFEPPFGKDQLPEWLNSNKDSDFKDLTGLLDFLLKISVDNGLPLQGSILAAMIYHIERSITEINDFIDMIIRDHLKANPE